jgi:surface antigen/phage tail protein X
MPSSVRSTSFYRRIELKLRRKTVRKRLIGYSMLAFNSLVLAIIAFIVLQNSHTSGLALAPADAINPSGVVNNPLDQVSSDDIALTVAQMSDLPETTAIDNQVETQNADIAMSSTNDGVIAKPQVVATALKSRADIQTYVTQAGDTIDALASKFGVTSNSILWSNGLALGVNNLTPGTNLTIPPVNGIVYTVKAGDTPQSLATRYGANEADIVAYNDAEISGLQPGEQIIIPNGTPPAATATTAANIASSSFPWGGDTPMYGYNGYDYGYCTWYVATQVSVPANWGNAATWAYYARLSGWNVSSAPSVGAIAQTADAAGGEGHVAMVTGVNPDGTIDIRDMNGLAGWGRVGAGTVPASEFQNFISH